MAYTHTEICVKLFIAFFLVMCDALHLEYSTTPATSLHPGHHSTLSMTHKHDQENTYRDETKLEEEPNPDNLEGTLSKIPKEKQKFFIHLEFQSSSAKNSNCHLLTVNGKFTPNVTDINNCYIIVNNLDNNSLEILNNIELFCREDENYKHRAHIEKAWHTRCESTNGVRDGYKIVRANAKATFTSDFLSRICENTGILNSSKIDSSESSTCVAISKSYLYYENQQCCTGSFQFIPRGAFQIEVFMFWLDKNGYSHIFEVCFALSFVCLIIIFVSGIVSRNYRRERGNQILIHFAFSIFAQIMLHVIACFIKISPIWCDLQSILFHYFTLVESCWTSIIAYLQYKRFVKVFDNEPNHLIFKLCVIAYISPIFPISLWIFYHDLNIELVNYLTFGLPEFFIMLTNSTFLLLITKNIVFVRNEYIEHKKSLSMEVKLIFFLFFVLDFSWFQIILAHLTTNKFFMYLFLITQSMQGFMLFFVFGIMNDHNRLIYKKFFALYVAKIL